MSEAVVTPVTVEPLARVRVALDGLRDLPLNLTTDDELLEFWRGLEAVSRQLSSIEHDVIAGASARQLDRQAGARTMPAFMRTLLGIDIGEARARVTAAEACGPRQTLSGESLPPICPTVAAAQSRGDISNRHARVIIDLLDALPDVVQVEQGCEIESFFVAQAQIFDPATLQKLALHQLEVVGAEGCEPGYRDRRRNFALHVRSDGSCTFSGEGTAEFAEYLRVAFDAFGSPCPETSANQQSADAAQSVEPQCKDARTPGQRRHDAVIELIKAAMRAGEVPPVGGLSATIVLTVDADDWAHGTGSAATGHGVRIPTAEARRWVGGDARVIGVALDQLRAVVAHSGCHRIFTENQRLAMNARDGGCAFVGCDVPVHLTEAHHVVEYARGGRTSIDNGALLCSRHHRSFEQAGWRCVMIDRIPHFVPPRWIDPQQRPRRNWMHHPELHPPDRSRSDE